MHFFGQGSQQVQGDMTNGILNQMQVLNQQFVIAWKPAEQSLDRVDGFRLDLATLGEIVVFVLLGHGVFRFRFSKPLIMPPFWHYAYDGRQLGKSGELRE